MLSEIVVNYINEELPATKKAHQLNLKHVGFGRWADSSGNTIAYTDFKTGNLVMKKDSEIEKSPSSKKTKTSKYPKAPKSPKKKEKDGGDDDIKSTPIDSIEKSESIPETLIHVSNIKHIGNKKIKTIAVEFVDKFMQIKKNPDITSVKRLLASYDNFINKIDTPTTNVKDGKDVVLATNLLYYMENYFKKSYDIKKIVPKRKCKIHLSTKYKIIKNQFSNPSIRRDLLYLSDTAVHDIFSTKIVNFKSKLVTYFEKYRKDITHYYGLDVNSKVEDLFDLLSNGNRPIYDFNSNLPKKAKPSALFFNKKVLNKSDWELYSICMLITEAIFNTHILYNDKSDEEYVPILRVQFVRTAKKSKKGKVIPKCLFTSYYKFAPKGHLDKWNKHDIKKD